MRMHFYLASEMKSHYDHCNRNITLHPAIMTPRRVMQKTP